MGGSEAGRTEIDLEEREGSQVGAQRSRRAGAVRRRRQEKGCEVKISEGEPGSLDFAPQGILVDSLVSEQLPGRRV